MIILKSAPTFHLIYYAMFETLFFIRFGSFSMFIDDFAAIGRKKFAARYFWLKAKLKQKKLIFKQYSVTSYSVTSRIYYLAQFVCFSKNLYF